MFTPICEPGCMGRTYLIVVLFLGLFGAMAGRMDKPSGPPSAFEQYANRVEQSDGSAIDQSKRTTRDHGDAIVLDRRSDGHFYADVKLNGTTINMLVDTGASGIALSSDDARRAGIATSIGMNEHIGEGAGGAVYGDVVEIKRVQLGDAEQEEVQAVVLKGGEISLLGQSFLGEFGSVRIEGDEMILR